QDPQMPTPDLGSDARGRLEDRRERPERERQVAEREVVANLALLTAARDEACERRLDAPAAFGESRVGAVAKEDTPQRKVPGLELEHPLEEGDPTVPGVRGRGGLLGRREDLIDVLRVDHLDERVAGREVAIERPDPHA